MKTLLAIALALPLVCQAQITNLTTVDAGKCIFKGHEPSEKDLTWLKSIGVSNIVNLSIEDRMHHKAKALGMNVLHFPFSKHECMGVTPENKVMLASASITSGTYVYDSEGTDAAGVVVAVYRVQSQHWSKDNAARELLNQGFHPIMQGLWRFWQFQFKPK